MSSNLPPGCGRLPGEEPDGITRAQEDVWDILEKYLFPEAACLRIMEAIVKEDNAIMAEIYQREAEAEAEVYERSKEYWAQIEEEQSRQERSAQDYADEAEREYQPDRGKGSL